MLLGTQPDVSCASDRGVRCGMIADDLTGACDAGVQFAERGFSALVRVGVGEEAAEIAVMVTNSRNDPPEAARAKVLHACETLHKERRAVLFKKIDSTLRGNLGAEIATALESSGASLALVAPSFPAQGRTLEAGRLRINGIAMARGHLPTLLREQGVERMAHISRQFLIGGARALTARLDEAAKTAPTVVTVDAITEEDLVLLAQAAEDYPARILMVGSAGLAAAVAQLLATRYARRASPLGQAQSAAKAGLVALVVGSTTPVTAAQLTQFMVTHRCAVFDLPTTNLWPIRRALRERRHVILRVAFQGELRRCLARCRKVLIEHDVRGVILSGGETATMACEAWEARGIRLEREIAPGLPWGRLAGGPAEGLPLATKAGSFGDRDALNVMAEFLAQQPKVSR
ncbi:MAG: hypothetical protein LAP13_02615 [Acidobacteriia bacterium]|nr:hypothetical protein [Terriglobia bacterium]